MLLISLSWAAAAQAQAIWKWRDASGAIQISDRAPPKDVQDKDILQRPTNIRPATVADAAAAAASAVAPTMPATAASGVDSELEAKRRKLLQDQKAQRQAQEAAQKERQQAARAENCERTRNYLAALDGGQRLARLNAKGEKEVLDDAARADERQRTLAQIEQNCR